MHGTPCLAMRCADKAKAVAAAEAVAQRQADDLQALVDAAESATAAAETTAEAHSQALILATADHEREVAALKDSAKLAN